MSLRWQDYVLCYEDEVLAAWDAARRSGPTLYVLGVGFDPRALVGLRRLLETGADDTTVAWVELGAARDDSVTGLMAKNNVAQLDALLRDHNVGEIRIPYPDVQEHRSAGRQIAVGLVGEEVFAGAGHVVVDVSGLPNTIYFPLVGSILTAVDDARFDGEVQVAVCENPLLDGLIVGAGVGGVSPIAGFKHGLDVESEPHEIRVWAPVIGERAGAQLAAIRQHLDPREICPVLPCPARDPRRADRLFLEHRELLVDTLEVEPGNFIYADESNPFDLYRGLSQLHARYGRALRPLGPSGSSRPCTRPRCSP